MTAVEPRSADTMAAPIDRSISWSARRQQSPSIRSRSMRRPSRQGWRPPSGCASSEDLALVGVGRAWSVEADGQDRFATADRAWQALASALGPDDPSLPRGVGPVLLGGLGFTGRLPEPDDTWAPFGAASLVLPETIVARTGGGSWLTTTTPDATTPGGPTPLGPHPHPGPGAGSGTRRPGGPSGRPPADHHERATGRGAVAPDRRAVRRRGRARAPRQGRPGAPRRAVLACRSRCGERAAPSRGERPREHDLRVPSRRPDVPGRNARAPDPH